MNGADGFLRRSRRLTSVTPNVLRPSRSERTRSASRLVGDLCLLAVDLMELGGEPLPRLLQQRLDGPVLDRLEGADLPLALDDEPQRDGLHATRRDPLLHRLPEHGARLVADETIQNAPRLLRLDLLVVDLAGLLDGVLDGVLGDLVEQDATHRHRRRAALGPDLLGDVPGDRLSLAIRVGGDEDFARILRRALQIGDRLLLPGDRNELGLEALLDVDARASSRAGP